MISLEAVKFSFEFSSVPILMADADGMIVHANSDLERLFQYDTGDLNGQPVECLVPASLRERHPQFVSAFMRVPAKRAMGQGRSLVGVSKYGEEIPLELGLNSVVIEDQRYSVVVAVDLRKQLGHEKKMTLAMEAAATAMIMVGDAGTIVLTNAAAERLTGYDRLELAGQSIEMLIPEAARVAHRVYRANYAASPEERQMSRGIDITVRQKDGAEVPVEIALTPVSTPEGNMVMSTIVDLRERIAAERAMQDKNTELDKANRDLTGMNSELTQFTYAVSHDLKAPLASLQGLLSLVLEDVRGQVYDDVPDQIARAIGICERNSAKVERILNFAKSVEDQETVFVDIEQMIDEVWDSIAPGSSVPATLVKDIGIPRIETAHISLEVILQNLLSNAVNYHDPDKSGVEVTVTTRKGKEGYVIEVADNGIGIDDANLPRVFEMFKRFDIRGGDGIGLALAQKHISRIGGKLSLTSKLKRGTSAKVEIPLA